MVSHLISGGKLKRYVKEFLNNFVEVEYYVNRTVESDLNSNFLNSFENHKLFKFIGLNMKLNPNHVKAFYCNLKISSDCLE